ncbi:Hypothetical protein PHPALM_18558 [Phytophthora palmivora]|uniref:PHD-type domain-containing protein n=1 Tax=Phytophthora palmivora TaxID=4796 RepID=A0A2P4XJG5_9STRA|nr:Hypothetical protein PHPALM_18558 [Phytophthora palmivora]
MAPEAREIRAEIPALLTAAERQCNKQFCKPQYRQRWGWHDGERPKLSSAETVEFVRTYAWPKETEMALQALFEGDYDVQKAVEIIHDTRRENLRLKREETERIQNFTFEKAMDRHGKKFHLVKRRLGRSVTTRELVNKFYLWKNTPEYEKWHDGQREKKRKREAKRIAQQRPAADQHMEFCEICLKGGKLLCCDGCERAYHLNCVRPALLDVPEGDWFCSHCRDAATKIPLAKISKSVDVPGPDTSKPNSKPKTRPNGCSLKGGSDVLPATHVDDVKKVKVKPLATKKEKNHARSEPAASSDSKTMSDHPSPETLSPNDAISDITTESESDGGTAKVFQSLSPKYVVMAPSRERKKHHRRLAAVVGQSRFSSPSRSLEYLSSPLSTNHRDVRREVRPLQMEIVSSARKRKRHSDSQHNIPHSLAMGV